MKNKKLSVGEWVFMVVVLGILLVVVLSHHKVKSQPVEIGGDVIQAQ